MFSVYEKRPNNDEANELNKVIVMTDDDEFELI